MYAPFTVADILFRELGLEHAIIYAERIAAVDGPLSNEYREAAQILRQHGNTDRLNIADSLKSLYDTQ